MTKKVVHVFVKSTAQASVVAVILTALGDLRDASVQVRAKPLVSARHKVRPAVQ